MTMILKSSLTAIGLSAITIIGYVGTTLKSTETELR